MAQKNLKDKEAQRQENIEQTVSATEQFYNEHKKMIWGALAALLVIVLGILAEDLENYKAAGYAPYVRLLGFRKDAAPLLTELKTRSRIPILSKTADAPALLGTGTPAAKMLASEAYASALWDSVFFERTGIRLPEFPQKQMVIV